PPPYTAAGRPIASQGRQLGPGDLRADRVDVVPHPADDRLIADHAEDPAVLFHQDPPDALFGHDLRDSIDPFARIDEDEGPRHQFLEADRGGVPPCGDDLREDVPLRHDTDGPSLRRCHDDESLAAIRHRFRGSEKARTVSCPWGTGSPAKIACMRVKGIRAAMMANARPRFTRNPTLKSVDDVPAATPRRWTGTEWMIEATFGAMNRPPPMPAR